MGWVAVDQTAGRRSALSGPLGRWRRDDGPVGGLHQSRRSCHLHAVGLTEDHRARRGHYSTTRVQLEALACASHSDRIGRAGRGWAVFRPPVGGFRPGRREGTPVSFAARREIADRTGWDHRMEPANGQTGAGRDESAKWHQKSDRWHFTPLDHWRPKELAGRDRRGSRACCSREAKTEHAQFLPERHHERCPGRQKPSMLGF